MFPSAPLKNSDAGFTLIEVLVALSIIAITLAPIGALIATSMRGTRSIETHLIRLETARGIVTALPDRKNLNTGVLSGEIAGHHWDVNVSNALNTRADLKWIPQNVAVTIHSPDGANIQIHTVRLRERSAK